MDERLSSNVKQSLVEDARHLAVLDRGTAFWAVQALLLTIATLLPAHNIRWLTCQLMFGIVMSQCMLAAIWAVLGPGSWRSRLLGPPIWIFLACLLGGARDRPDDAFLILLSCGVFAALAMIVTTGMVRVLIGVRLDIPGRITVDRPFQYQLKHALILMLVTSVLLGIGRLIDFTSLLRMRTFESLTLIGIAWAMSTLPLVFVSYSAERRRDFVVGLIGAMMVVALNAVASEWVMKMTELSGRDIVRPLVIIGVLSNLLALGGFLLNRRAGLRLVR